ncbi:MAG: hypothetical protein UY80_C0021G0002 [Parcubacteria group bacterium GW2011_GWB1_53_43]|nr:MAG: hypothetical protein UY80_C0021G0002 [Parcubacteria group bacterium GW2011_GWB1_53_43]
MLGIHTVIHAVELSAVCEGIRKVAEARAAVAQDICKNLRTEADIKRQSIKKWLNEYEQARKNYFLTILRERNEYWCGYCNRTYSRGTELPEEMFVEQERVVAKENEIATLLQEAPAEFTNDLVYRYQIPPQKCLVGQLICTLAVEDVYNVH